MDKPVLIFWPKGGNVESAANIIASEFGDINPIPLSEVTNDILAQFNNIIVGGSTTGSETWEGTKNESPWNDFFKLVDKVDFAEKTVAIFGLGDQVLWPSNFVDGLRTIYDAFDEKNAKLIGKWPTVGYDFRDSMAVDNGYFVGLALDEDQQDEYTEERVKAWVRQIKEEF